jgi:16S rRNA (guanine966-N2)-methyltransferase
MTRIIAGVYGGRRIGIPSDSRVRPTADRVREAWMSILGERLVGATVLDLFAGSGALGLEAISRGAVHATLVDIGRASIVAIDANVASLGVADQVTVHQSDAMRFVERLTPGQFDLALADPPYTVPFAERLAAAFLARPFARLLAIEHPATVSLGGDDTRRYGDTALTFLHAP